MTKRIFALLLAVVMVFALVACSGEKTPGNNNDTKAASGAPSGETYELNITVWVPDAATALTKKQIDDFNANNTYGIKVNATIDALSEADSATQVLNDVTTGADMYFFAQDQFSRLVKGNALAKVPDNMVSTIASENNASVVAAGKSGDTQYAYPLTNDNGYFMYYDKSVIPEEDLDSLEKLVADCEAANKYFAFEQDTSAWYLASFFFGAGCKSEWITDDDGNFISIDDNFNSDKGLIAVKGMQKLVQSPKFLSSSDVSEFANGAAIVVSGTWAYTDVQSILGDNLGATDLPSFEVDGKEYHLGSFSGCKLLGVKPQADADRAAAIHLLAQYLTSESAQLERFNELAWGPANTKAAADPAVQANPALVALNAQNAYATPQGQIEGSWWDIAKVIGSEVKEAKSEDDLKKALQNYSDKIDAVFERTPEQLAAFSVIGSICGSNWDTDFPMEKDGNVYNSEVLELHKGDEFKFRKGASWDVNFGSDGNLNGPNFVVESSGKYILHLTVADDEGSASCEMELVEAIEDGPEPDTEPAPAIEGWSVIGGICGTSWDTDFPMTEAGATYVSEPLELHAGEELKCRKDGAWDENMGVDGPGGANLVVEEDGRYEVVLDIAGETIFLQPVAESWGVIGGICGTGWDTDFPMTQDEDGVWKSEPLELHAGEEFKLRQNADWAVNIGSDGQQDGPNFVVEEDGTYIISMKPGEEGAEVELIKQ